MSKTLLLIMVLLVFNFQQALAHDVWLHQQDGQLIVAYGHGEKRDAYESQKVKDPKAFDCKGGDVPLQVAWQKESVSLSWNRKPSTVTIFFDTGCWVKTTDGWKNLTKRDAQVKFTVLDSLKSRKYAKSLLAPCDSFAQPTGLVMEIVPEKDPFAVRPGETLPIKVLVEGKPYEGAEIKTGDAGHAESKDPSKTDKDGKASVVITKPGLQMVFATYRVPLEDDPEADRLSVATSLTFEAK